ncbi:TolC family protein [Mangrovibacterium marinum]|uniref:Outer membrane protein TolC n=1 Tax=Mangrovibacterium marinum TaxID=1639118 RepID=A0A2T5C6K1_9BACT|nr:TolC family protein [Mangrovibacterium marinum]PTN10577.1 outer membrane protein TolC [Mangrovibacterium marinum]
MKIRAQRSIFVLLLLASTIRLSAQDTLRFSLTEAKAYAMQNSYVIRNSSLDVDAARKKVWETIATGLPQVSGSASYTNFLNLPVSLIPAEFVGGNPGEYFEVTFGQKFNSDFGFTVNQKLFDGSYIVGVGSAKLYLQLSSQAKEKTEIEIRQAVEQAYYGALVARRNLSVLQENLSNNQKQFSDTKAMFENGFVEEQDVDQLKLIVQNSENEIIKAEREIRVAEMVLKYVMGVTVTDPVVLIDELDNFIDPILSGKEEPSGFDLATHIDYRLLESQRLSQIKLLRLEQSAYLPNLDAFYSWNKTSYGNSWNLFKSNVAWYPSSMWGLNLTVPIFSAGNKAARVKQARIELEKAENDQKLAEQTLQKDYLTAVADLESAIDQYRNDTDNKQLAKKIYDKTTVKYNNGMISSIELSQTESQYIQAQRAWVASATQLLNSKINLDKAIGKL